MCGQRDIEIERARGSFLSFPAYGIPVLIDQSLWQILSEWKREKKIFSMNSYRSFSGNVAGFHVKRNDFGKHMPNDEWKEKKCAHTHEVFEWNQCIMVSECEHAPSFKNEFLQQFAAKSTTHKQSTSAHRWVSIIYRILRGARFRIQFSQHFYHPPLNGIHSILP